MADICIGHVTHYYGNLHVAVLLLSDMSFGDRDQMLEMAKKRLDELKPIYPKADLLNHEYVRTIFLVIDDPKKYHKFASMEDSTVVAAIEHLLNPAVPVG